MDDLFEIEDLRDKSQRISSLRVSGIYFLFQDEKLNYIGQTLFLPNRLSTHFGSRIPFNRYTFLPVIQPELNRVEGDYIRKYRPPYNSQIPKSRLEIELERVLKYGAPWTKEERAHIEQKLKRMRIKRRPRIRAEEALSQQICAVLGIKMEKA